LYRCGLKVVLTSISLTIAGSAVAAAPAINTLYLSYTFSHAQCMNLASTAMRAAGLTRGFEVVGETTFGEVGDYTDAVRCVDEKKIAIVTVAGPNSQRGAKFTALHGDRQDRGDRVTQGGATDH
jgi:hypothetical protein